MTLQLPVPPGQRRTKIVATIGPATRNTDAIRSLLGAGVDVIRVNFSHATHENARWVIETARCVAKQQGRPLAILQDLQGPRLRVNGISGGSATLRTGNEFTLTTRRVPGNDEAVSVSYPRLPQEVSPGHGILLDDGMIRLRVLATGDRDIRCRIEEGGILTPRKGINVPGVGLQMPPLSEKDLKDLEFGIKMSVDYVALSFVRGAEDARTIRAAMHRLHSRVPIIAKIERAEAVEAIEEILRAFDAVMVARGDLGVEIGPERVPLIQKRIIASANALLKPVITATQMLESMVTNPTPTRAEASDVANAILDGTDAVMLSSETSIGAHPVEAVRFMDRIAQQADPAGSGGPPPASGPLDPARAVVSAANDLAGQVKARAIVVFTTSGRTGIIMAKHRPEVPIVAFTGSATVHNRLALVWGVTPVKTPMTVHTTEMIGYAEEVLARAGMVRRGDRMVVVGSAPLTARGRTNFIKVHTVRQRSRRPNGYRDI